MKKWLCLILLCFIPIKVFAVSLDGATSVILMDMDTTRVLLSKNVHTVRSVASISKIMTT
ncbi:MAG: hypothetical protein Q4G04_02740 [bacterium]|nr:hypothetical protein [bacterium]